MHRLIRIANRLNIVRKLVEDTSRNKLKDSTHDNKVIESRVDLKTISKSKINKLSSKIM